MKNRQHDKTIFIKIYCLEKYDEEKVTLQYFGDVITMFLEED